MLHVKMRWCFAKLNSNGLGITALPRLLGDAEVEKRLKKLQGWKHEGSFITKTFEFETFIERIRFLNRVARVAEEQEHHPEIHVRYARVKLSIQTHSSGGVTAWDIALAKAIDGMIPERSR